MNLRNEACHIKATNGYKWWLGPLFTKFQETVVVGKIKINLPGDDSVDTSNITGSVPQPCQYNQVKSDTTVII